MSELAFNDEIGPQLLAIGKRCEALGMPFVACVEYESGSFSTTSAQIAPTNIDMQVAYLAARYRCRLDDLLIAVARLIRESGEPHNSIALERFLPCDPTAR